MRLDKYLWALRYFKTRNMATEACKKGQIRVNELIAKPSREVYPMDQLIIRKNQINFQCTVLDIPSSRLGAKLVDRYRKDTTPLEALEQQKVAALAQEHYRKRGTGRPTKKERRDLSDYAQEQEEEDYEA
ncbi:MAG: RNA-binding S4 domain-containing protein [Flavobacteriaceae bacterium]|nr:RNA-binding S4 domain-containing protein [Flavobacteriaceae bacterium]MCI5088797.1 RNA-binding S4 domain-containing protein [Flavobacteriaceae bacterium]